MIRHRFAKPALAVLGALVLIGVYNSTQHSRRAQYALRPASFQQFDSSLENASAPQPDSPGATVPQSVDDGNEQQTAYGEQPQQAEYGAQQVAYSAQPPANEAYEQQAPASRSAQYAPASNGPAPTHAGTRWTGLVSPDGSATVALPDNWRIAGGGKGVVAIEGPNSEQVVLGFQTFVTANQAPYMAPEQALAWFMRSHGMRLAGIQQHEAQQARSGQAELIVGESEMQGRQYKLIARVTTAQIGMGNWMLQISSMGAPIGQFDAEFPTMQKIWNSWNLDPNYVRNAFQNAAAMNQQTAAMVANGAMARFNSWKPFNESFDQTLRGVSTMENQTLGKRVETQIGTEQQYLNNCARNGQDCRQVPMNELVPQQ